MQMLRKGKKATVRGREIGKKLTDLVEKVGLELPMPQFFVALENYRSDQTEKLKAREKDAELIMMNDMVDTIICFAEEATSPAGINQKIENIFSDETVGGIQFSTIHKAKGLQFKRCFLLRPDLLPHPMAKTADAQTQEKNLEYVCYTRAEEIFVFVAPEKDELKPQRKEI
jgi:superfamily I DNA/RNA helicase